MKQSRLLQNGLFVILNEVKALNMIKASVGGTGFQPVH
jgi:hypothetical protein